jgi:hypothetical protein
VSDLPNLSPARQQILLLFAERNDWYPAAVAARLCCADHAPGRLMRGLERDGLLSVAPQIVENRARLIYSLTSEGVRVLAFYQHAREHWQTLSV